MGIVSYAQNFEDVILWRALGNIANGTYVDVGAHHPDIDSVSKAFYDHGWKGVHVEPGPIAAQLLREKRPGDTIIQVMVSTKRGICPFYETPGGGLSTADKEVADFHLNAGNAQITATTVVSVTLDDVLDQSPAGEIHWLKIDVEGFEREALLSWQNSPRRPWILLIEATYPKTQSPRHNQWEELVLSKGYEFAHDDGLNRFYVSEQHAQLSEKFKTPPNIFDEFQLDPSGSSAFCRDMKLFLEGELVSRDNRIADLEQRLANAQADLRSAENDLQAQTAAHQALNQCWREATARADQLSDRLIGREERFLRQEGVLAEHGDELAAIETSLKRVSAQVYRHRFVPWPFRIFLPADRPFSQSHRRARPAANESLCLEQLLSLPDVEFLQQSYQIILGRDIDEIGRRHYYAKLTQGHRRPSIIASLVRSDEARQRESCVDLTDASDEEFISAAYLRLLGREVDPEGRQHYLAQLAVGCRRQRMMQHLRNSAEGQRYQAIIKRDIDELVRREEGRFAWRK